MGPMRWDQVAVNDPECRADASRRVTPVRDVPHRGLVGAYGLWQPGMDAMTSGGPDGDDQWIL